MHPSWNPRHIRTNVINITIYNMALSANSKVHSTGKIDYDFFLF